MKPFKMKKITFPRVEKMTEWSIFAFSKYTKLAFFHYGEASLVVLSFSPLTSR